MICVTGAFAAEVEINSGTASLYDAPGGNKIGSVGKGKRLKAEDGSENGYKKLKTKSGRALWVRESDIKSLNAKPEDDLVVDDVQAEESDFARLTYDIGFSTGSSGDVNYSEANFGLNYFFMRWLSWRNAVFARFISPENIYGLDSSARLFYNIGFGERSGVTLFGGPGYRFVNKGDNVPFAEAGLVTHLGSFNIGGGFKTFFNNVVRAGSSSDTQYFIILSGSGAL